MCLVRNRIVRLMRCGSISVGNWPGTTEDLLMLQALSDRIATSALAPLDALKGAFALGVSREVLDHAREDKPGGKAETKVV